MLIFNKGRERKRAKLAFREEKNEQRSEPVRVFEGSN